MSVFSPVNPIYLAWEYDALRDAWRAVVTSFLLLVNPLVIWHWNVLYGALKSIRWHGRNWFEKKCLWLHSSDINVWWANCSSCMAITAIRISSKFWSMTLRRLPRRSFRQNPLAETPIIFWDGLSRTFWAMFLLVFPTKIKSAEKAARNDPGNRIG